MEFQRPSEKLAAVNRINSLKDYYEILDVDRKATVEQINKAYRKLALLVHPDKNESPDASEAFKKLAQAVTVLTDPEQRRDFDKYGFNERPSDSPPTYTFHFKDSFEEKVFKAHFGDKESFTEAELKDIISQLSREEFGQNGDNKKKSRKKTRPTETWEDRQSSNERELNKGKKWAFIYLTLLSILPLVAAICLYRMPERLYSLEKIREYRLHRTTLNLSVPYFVKDSFFLEKFQGSRKAFEDIVEDEFISNVKNDCHHEMKTRESMMWKARNLSDRKMFKQAHYFKMAACDKLYKHGVVI